MNTSLTDFIAHARKKGMDHQTIRMLLLSNGWKEKDIASALTEQALDMPIPMPQDTGGAREAFFHLLTFVGLYTWVISLIVLFFSYINRLFPDPAFDYSYPYDGDLSTIRWSMAAVIVSFPLLYLLSRFLIREMKARPEKAWSGVRRWLTYLTLFVAASALMGDVITLVFYLLEGELTLRFLLKVLVVLLLAGSTFLYYFMSLRLHPSDAKGTMINKTFGWVAIAFTIIALVWGIALVGSPGSSRDKKFDEDRVNDLRAIQGEIYNITLGQDRYSPNGLPLPVKEPIPATLTDVQAKALYTKVDITDAQTLEPYGYRVIDATHFELCATFNFPRDEEYDIFWNHDAGNKCFAFDLTQPSK